MAGQPIDTHVRELAAFKRRHGHLAVSQHALELYKWASEQRYSWRAGQLNRTLEKQLRAIGFPFEVEACEWETTFCRVLAFRKRFGTFPSPRSDWRQWLDRERELHQRGHLSADREKRLRRIGALEA